jgi:hypothetical protein
MKKNVSKIKQTPFPCSFHMSNEGGKKYINLHPFPLNNKINQNK